MSNNERIIPKLENNFHESLFLLEIQFKKTPTKEIKEKLINYYIKGVDYYTGINQRDFSLYFQTKLLNIMKEQDHFERTIKNKMVEEDYTDKINEIMKKYNEINDVPKNTINDEFQKQKENFLFNLAFKKKYKRLRFKSSKVVSNTKNMLASKSRKDLEQLRKKTSIDLPIYHNKLKSKLNNNLIFTKIDNTLIDFNKINTRMLARRY